VACATGNQPDTAWSESLTRGKWQDLKIVITIEIKAAAENDKEDNCKKCKLNAYI